MELFAQLESEVRSYSRSFPVVFSQAEGSYLYDEAGRAYLDFLTGAGALSYGHNNPFLRRALLDYIGHGGVIHALDMATTAKREFMSMFQDTILLPRRLDYKLQFTGPTGTNAVEAALKLARKVKRRSNVISFIGGFHGVTLGSLALTTDQKYRGAAGVPLENVIHVPYCGISDGNESLTAIQETLTRLQGADTPAAIILETVQAEGGVHPCRFDWLKAVEQLAHENDLLLIVDDIQVGCGRTGPFFSFEPAGITPDIICLSKALSGYGLPFSLVLLKRDLDIWQPGEHNGTFRGLNLAFVTGAAALGYWKDTSLSLRIATLSQYVFARLQHIWQSYPDVCGEPRGRGLILGLPFHQPGFAWKVSREAFNEGLVVEAVGSGGDVLKFLPSLLIADGELEQGLDIVEHSVAVVVESA